MASAADGKWNYLVKSWLPSTKEGKENGAVGLLRFFTLNFGMQNPLDSDSDLGYIKRRNVHEL